MSKLPGHWKLVRWNPVQWIVAAACLIVSTSNEVGAQSATYQLTFSSDWTATNHPGAYPNGAHFSPLIGGVHNGSVSYWEPGGIASNAIEVMAETGGTFQLRNLVLGDITTGAADSLVQGAGINGPGSTTVNFDVSASHPLLTLVTMIAPSPDWFVGVTGLDLRANGAWVESLSLDLANWDAGTDAGVNFTSGNINVNPHEPISLVGSPLAGLPPIGHFELTLVDSTALCDLDGDGSCGVTDLDSLLSVGPIANGVAVTFGANDQYDLNGDGEINLLDRDAWLAGAATENGFASPYSPADADLNGVTDGLDFIAWNDNRFSASLAASEGDFNGDGIVDGLDFVVWNEFKFTSSDVTAVPEPTASCLLIGVALIGLRRH